MLELFGTHATELASRILYDPGVRDAVMKVIADLAKAFSPTRQPLDESIDQIVYLAGILADDFAYM